MTLYAKIKNLITRNEYYVRGVVAWLALIQISFITGTLDFRIVEQNSTFSTLQCSVNEKFQVGKYPYIYVNYDGMNIKETDNVTKFTITTSTPLCGMNKNFSCITHYNNNRNVKHLTMTSSHDRLTINTGENKSPCLPTNKNVTMGCLVNNLCTKENVLFVESPDYSVLSQDLFFDEITSSRGETRFFGIAVASMTFYRGGKVNVTCRATSGKSTTKAFDVFDCKNNDEQHFDLNRTKDLNVGQDEQTKTKNVQKVVIDTNGLSHLPTNKKVIIGCTVKNMLSKEVIWLDGNNIYQPEVPSLFYTEIISVVGEERYFGFAAFPITFVEIGVSNLTCRTESGESATKSITVVKSEEVRSSVLALYISIGTAGCVVLFFVVKCFRKAFPAVRARICRESTVPQREPTQSAELDMLNNVPGSDPPKNDCSMDRNVTDQQEDSTIPVVVDTTSCEPPDTEWLRCGKLTYQPEDSPISPEENTALLHEDQPQRTCDLTDSPESEFRNQVQVNRHSKQRFWEISNKIETLNRRNIDEVIITIKGILDTGEIQSSQSTSILRLLIEKTDVLYEEEAFTDLVKIFYQGIGNADITDVADNIWSQFKDICIESRQKVKEYKDKLKIFVRLDSSLSTRLLLKLTHSLSTSLDNEKWLEVMTFLLEENADPFMLLDEDSETAFTAFLKFSFQLQEAVTSAEIYLRKMYQKLTVCNLHESILNDVIKSIPDNWFDKDCDHLSSNKEILVKVCLKMKRAKPALCDVEDEKGRTPLHNLMKKLDYFWLNSAEQLVEDSLWNLTSELITKVNVNVKADDNIAPYSMVILWKRKVRSVPDPVRQKIAKAWDKLDQLFLACGAKEQIYIQKLKTM